MPRTRPQSCPSCRRPAPACCSLPRLRSALGFADAAFRSMPSGTSLPPAVLYRHRGSVVLFAAFAALAAPSAPPSCASPSVSHRIGSSGLAAVASCHRLDRRVVVARLRIRTRLQQQLIQVRDLRVRRHRRGILLLELFERLLSSGLILSMYSLRVMSKSTALSSPGASFTLSTKSMLTPCEYAPQDSCPAQARALVVALRVQRKGERVLACLRVAAFLSVVNLTSPLVTGCPAGFCTCP